MIPSLLETPCRQAFIMTITVCLLISLTGGAAGAAAESEVRYLSGTGPSNAIEWEFRSLSPEDKTWSSMPVPACWEMHLGPKLPEVAEYRHVFPAEAAWKGRTVQLYFDGVLTDAAVQINGVSAGAEHKGGFYRFGYDITSLLKYGADNILTVRVRRISSDGSVANAESGEKEWRAYSGIYRPVTLRISPTSFVDTVAVDAKGDGGLNAKVITKGPIEGLSLTACILDGDGKTVGDPLNGKLEEKTRIWRLSGSVKGVRPWSAERPILYTLQVDLQRSGSLIHRHRERIGFRTVELRPNDGFSINGSKVRFRGVNRHCLWPTTGRSMDPAISLQDVKLIKGMNANAVRAAHYPPDKHFLEYCDQHGLYVLLEFTGMTGYYDTAIGKSLVDEMLAYLGNHPSIFLFSNGNEGLRGRNEELTGYIHQQDIQRRQVVYPKKTHPAKLIDTPHYIGYHGLMRRISADGNNKKRVTLSTEFNHSLYLGGGAANMARTWEMVLQSPTSAGLFIWEMFDQGAWDWHRGKRRLYVDPDLGDGIMGPSREKDGSYDALREIWSPVKIDLETITADFDGALPVQNRFHYINLSACRLDCSLFVIDALKRKTRQTWTTSVPGPSVPPGAKGSWPLPLPEDWRSADGLALRIWSPEGLLVSERNWMLVDAPALSARLVAEPSPNPPTVEETAEAIIVAAGNTVYRFDPTSGRLLDAARNGKTLALQGPFLSQGKASPTAVQVSTQEDGKIIRIAVSYAGDSDLKELEWRIAGNGWCTLRYRARLDGTFDYHGIDFDCPIEQTARWHRFGRGPHRVWRNRLDGGTHDYWSNTYKRLDPATDWDYPAFHGYFADLRWAAYEMPAGVLEWVVEDAPYFRNGTPEFGKQFKGYSGAPFPKHDLSILQSIPSISHKWGGERRGDGAWMSPQTVSGEFGATVHVRFTDLMETTSP